MVYHIHGRYPERVKRRIAGDLGHLSNEQAVAFLAAVANPELQVVVGHISEENNHADLLAAAFEPLVPEVGELTFASQDEGAAWVTLDANADHDVTLREAGAVGR